MKAPYKVALSAIALVLASCAGSTPAPKFTKTSSVVITQADKTKTSVTSSDNRMLGVDRKRLEEKIEKSISNAAKASQGKGTSYQVDVAISRYDEGNAFVRSMMAGMGQIHIDGIVTVSKMPGKEKISEFAMNKTFAWGGIYGGVTNMDTIEDTYAKAVAEAVCGK